MPTDVVQAQVSVGEYVQQRGVNVLWNIDSTDSADWAQEESFTRMAVDPGRGANPPAYADKVARVQNAVLSDAKVAAGKSVIILMHDTHNATRDALRPIIQGLRSAGYSFGTIEDLVAARWHRRSVEVTPGPRLYDACTPEPDRGCSARSSGQQHDVCGRFWKAWSGAGGSDKLGLPLAEPMLNASGILEQRFERGTIALQPDRPTPCDALWIRGQ
jgi:hypothetical protein